MVYKLAVCPKCQWYTTPQFEGHQPVCMPCLAKDQRKLNKTARITINVDSLKKAQRCRVIDVVAKDSPFKRKKGPFGLNRNIIQKSMANAK